MPAPTDQRLWLQIWAFCSINEVAKELEEPFMDEKNDIALAGARSHRRPQIPRPHAARSSNGLTGRVVWPRADLHVDFNEKIIALINRLTWRSSWPERSVGMLHSWRGEAPSKREAVARFADEESLRSLASMGQEDEGAGEEAEGFALEQPPPSARSSRARDPRDGRAARGDEDEEEEEQRVTQP